VGTSKAKRRDAVLPEGEVMETFVMFTVVGGFLMGMGITVALLGVVIYFWGME